MAPNVDGPEEKMLQHLLCTRSFVQGYLVLIFRNPGSPNVVPSILKCVDHFLNFQISTTWWSPLPGGTLSPPTSHVSFPFPKRGPPPSPSFIEHPFPLPPSTLPSPVGMDSLSNLLFSCNPRVALPFSPSHFLWWASPFLPSPQQMRIPSPTFHSAATTMETDASPFPLP